MKGYFKKWLIGLSKLKDGRRTHLPHMESLNLSQYPPAPVIWSYNAVDTLCEMLGVDDWRNRVLPGSMTVPGAWLSPEYRLETRCADLMPPLLTYPEFLEANPGLKATSWSSIRTFAFETPSTALGDLATPTSFRVLVVLVLLMRAVKAVIQPASSDFGRRVGCATHGKEWEAQNQERIQKFGEYVFKLGYHLAISLWGIYSFWDEEWWRAGSTAALYLEYPDQPIRPGMAWYYLVQSAYNVEEMLSLLELSFTVSSNRIIWSDRVRGDFREMFIHHLITNMLVFGSSCRRLTRIGSMIFMLHNVSDVPADLSKLANFLKWKNATVACFITMCACWAYCRLTILPFTVFRSVLNESWILCANRVIPPIYYVFYKPIFVILISLLLVLHLVWFGMFIKMGYVLMTKGEAQDLTEHKNGESSTEGKKMI